MIECKSFGNVFSDAYLHEPKWEKYTPFLSLIGTDSVVKAASAVFLTNHALYFGEDAAVKLTRHHKFDSYRCLNKRVSPHVLHCLIFPCGDSNSLVIGRNEGEVKTRVIKRVQSQIPFLIEWEDWLWDWIIQTNSYTPLTGHNLAGGWVYVNYNDLKRAITKNIESLKQLL